MYLAQYGYLSPSVRNPSSGHIMDESSWRRAIQEFQSFAGLNATGTASYTNVKSHEGKCFSTTFMTMRIGYFKGYRHNL